MPDAPTTLNDLIKDIDEATVTPAVQPLVEGFKELAKAVNNLADKGEEDDSDPDTDEDIKAKLAEHEKRLDEHEDKMKDDDDEGEDDDEMEKGVLALDVTDALERLIKAVRGLPAEIATLRAENEELRKAVVAQTEHTGRLTKAVMDLGAVRPAPVAEPVHAEAEGQRFTPPVVLAAPDRTKLIKAVRTGTISAAQFDRFTSTGRFAVDDTTNANLLQQVNAL